MPRIPLVLTNGHLKISSKYLRTLGSATTMLRNHYETLALPSPLIKDQRITQQDIKAAYRHALLYHHPDKSNSKLDQSKITIDDISTAYRVLSDPASRLEFDRLLRLQVPNQSLIASRSHTGLENVDLDDLKYDENEGTWHRSCRCGDEKAFTVTEEELDKEADRGEVFTECRGCSLWLRVVFEQAHAG